MNLGDLDDHEACRATIITELDRLVSDNIALRHTVRQLQDAIRPFADIWFRRFADPNARVPVQWLAPAQWERLAALAKEGRE